MELARRFFDDFRLRQFPCYRRTGQPSANGYARITAQKHLPFKAQTRILPKINIFQILRKVLVDRCQQPLRIQMAFFTVNHERALRHAAERQRNLAVNIAVIRL